MNVDTSTSPNKRSLPTGLKEFHDYLITPPSSTDVTSVEMLYQEGIQAMKIATRQYAKRQTHWIRNRLAPRVFDEKKRNGRFGFYILDATGIGHPWMLIWQSK